MQPMNNKKEITIYDIAEKLKISPATVSRGLSNHPGIKNSTRENIIRMASSMGYRFNRQASTLRTKRTHTIGIIIPRLNSIFMSELIAGAEKVLSNANYNLIISQSLESQEKEKKNAATMYNSRVDGLLVSLAYDTAQTDHFTNFTEAGVPLIFFDRTMDHPDAPSIVIDNFIAAKEITKHLIEQGCRRILHISSASAQNVYRQRFKGYQSALEENGIPFDQDLVFYNELDVADGISAAGKILEMPHRPDGIFVSNDSCAIACMQALKQNGISIPKDIKIAGFNNDPISRIIDPALTTVHYNAKEMGRIAAETLLSMLENPVNAIPWKTLTLRHELLIRASTGVNDKT